MTKRPFGIDKVVFIAAVLGTAAMLIFAWYQFSWSYGMPVSARAMDAELLRSAKINRDRDRVAGAVVVASSLSPVSQPPRAPRPYETELHRRLFESRNLYPLYQELLRRNDAEAKFFRAIILDACKGWGTTFRGESNQSRIDQTNAGMTGNFVALRRSIHAEKMQKSPQIICRDFPTPISQADIDTAFKEAADAGDPRGKLDQLNRSLIDGGVTTPLSAAEGATVRVMSITVPKGPTMAEADLLKSALASKDPSQILAAGPILSAAYSEYELKFGDGKGLTGIPDTFLWKSVACHYAGGCDASSSLVQRECVINERCDVTSYDELLQKYQFTEEKWTQFQEYRATIIRAIDSQDWSLLKESRGPATNTFRNTLNLPRSPRFRIRVGN